MNLLIIKFRLSCCSYISIKSSYFPRHHLWCWRMSFARVRSLSLSHPYTHTHARARTHTSVVSCVLIYKFLNAKKSTKISELNCMKYFPHLICFYLLAQYNLMYKV